ncbi:hypothetical protein HanIR_Chr16g0828491 [Helianthus annuus]|nr:hypothetical protein HanIR_Chr16g0828491 [Helianthus annuus]
MCRLFFSISSLFFRRYFNKKRLHKLFLPDLVQPLLKFSKVYRRLNTTINYHRPSPPPPTTTVYHHRTSPPLPSITITTTTVHHSPLPSTTIIHHPPLSSTTTIVHRHPPPPSVHQHQFILEVYTR